MGERRESDTAEIKAMLVMRADSLARQLAPGGHRAGIYWMAKNPTRTDARPGSFWIAVSGARAGAWADEATGDGAAQNRNGAHKGDVLGLIGYVLKRLSIPVAPVVLGLVLGGTLENTYRTALILNEGSYQGFLDSTVALVFFALTLLMIGGQMWTSRRKGVSPAAVQA